MGFLSSFGLMQRTKDGSQLSNIFINTSKDRLNCALSVGDLFLVSSPCARRTAENIATNILQNWKEVLVQRRRNPEDTLL